MDLNIREYKTNRGGKEITRYTIEIPASVMEFMGWKKGKIEAKLNARQKTATFKQSFSLLERGSNDAK